MPGYFSDEKYERIKETYQMWKIANIVEFSATKPLSAKNSAY